VTTGASVLKELRFSLGHAEELMRLSITQNIELDDKQIDGYLDAFKVSNPKQLFVCTI